MSRLGGVVRPGLSLAAVVFFFVRRELGRVVTPIRIHALSPRNLRGYAMMEGAQESADSLPRSLKKLGQVRVATRVGCPFWIDINSAGGRDSGLRSEQLEALSEYEESSEFTDQERTALRLADAMTRTPAEIPNELFEQLEVHFSERQVTELASALAWENYRARFNRVFLVESEEFSAGAYCPLPIGSESE